jgi:hypothetical protein
MLAINSRATTNAPPRPSCGVVSVQPMPSAANAKNTVKMIISTPCSNTCEPQRMANALPRCHPVMPIMAAGTTTMQ